MSQREAVAVQKQRTAQASGILQRKCDGCRKKKAKGILQRRAMRDDPVMDVPPIVHEVLRTPGAPLDADAQAFMELRFGQDFSRIRVHTGRRPANALPESNAVTYSVGGNITLGAGEDAPDIEPGQVRPREHRPPEEGAEPSDRPASPSEPDIHPGGPAMRSSSIFYVNFHHPRPPEVPDHSQRQPGPGGAAANRAGYTRVHLGKRMNIPWDTGPTQSSGRIPLFAKSVNIYYRLDPIEVFISSDYAASSCPDRVTLEHERSHVRDFLRIFRESYQPLIDALGRVDVPTRNSPRMAEPANVEAEQEAIGEQLRQVILSHASSLVARMKADRRAKDAPSAYAAVYSRCPASEWQRWRGPMGSEKGGVAR